MVGFVILAVLLILGALGVVTLRQPVHVALSLVGTLLALAVTYVTLDAHFLGAIQVIVYAGAIMVLFLFVIMLLNVRGEGEKRPAWPRVAALVAALLAVAGITVTAFLDGRALPPAETITAALGGGGAEQIGELLFTDFLLAFQLVGVLLLTGIVGAVGLVQRKPAKPRAAEGEALPARIGPAARARSEEA